MSLAIVGTGTEVGKTVVSALVLARYGGSRALAYWKPVATGDETVKSLAPGSATDTETIKSLAPGSATDTETVRSLAPGSVAVLPEGYRFAAPVSPHLAARLEGAAIDPRRLHAVLAGHRAAAPERALVVEGIGGLLVPLGDDGPLLIDWLAASGLPCLLVALSGLGTINHTLLSLAALRSRGMTVAGVVMNGPPDAENRAAIERFGEVAVVAEVARLDPLDRAAVARAAKGFDRDERLARHLVRA